MQKTTTTVIDFPQKALGLSNKISTPHHSLPRRQDDEQKGVDTADAVAFTTCSARVQVRMQLNSLVQTEKDLLILQAAVEKSLTHIRAGRRRHDDTALGAVRQLLTDTNKILNVRVRVPEKSIAS